jgi:SSS family solute:Na+ symporter
MHWQPLQAVLAMLYICGLLLAGILAARHRRDSNQFLNATASLPFWLCATACIASNCGSLDVIAMMALGAQYGMLACHFYWIGAVPALVVLGFWLIPAYAEGHYPTVLDFIGAYCGARARLVVTLCMALMMLLLSGVCLCAVAQSITALFGWSFLRAVLLTTVVVSFYTALGGFRATVYAELIHFAVVLAAVVPLLFFMLHDFGGLHRMIADLPANRLHTWQSIPIVSPHATMDCLGLVVGLGFVLSFGFWSTDFVQMQRALAVRNKKRVAYVPLTMAAAKMIFAFFIVLPGAAAPLVLAHWGREGFNATLPLLMQHYYSPAWVALGFLGLTASLVSTFANNVAGFSSASVQGIYQQWIRPHAPEAHYVLMGRMSNLAAIVISIGAAYMALQYLSLMEYIQLILSTFNAPLFALVATAALAPAVAARGGLGGFVIGVGSAVLHQTLVHTGVLHYGSQMSANFYCAMVSFSVSAIGIWVIASRRRAGGAPVHPNARVRLGFSHATVLWAIAVVGACALLNGLVW